MNSEKRIIITHCVDPHHFYFKYVDECINNDYSNFDYVLQCYGNDLHGRQLRTHNPNKNELIIFFDVISNKWLRGRVSKINDAEVTLWCIDNGIVRKTEKQFIQPLTENLKKDFNLVQSGGLSVLPAESTLDFETLNVNMQVTHSWDDEMNNNFKVIIGSTKRFQFIEEMQLENHKFGTLLSESRKDKIVVINEVLLQMNKAISCCGSEDMVSYVSEKRFKEYFYQSLEKATTFSKSIKSKAASIQSNNSEFEMHTNPFKSITSPVVSAKSDGIELHLEPVKSKETSKTPDHFKTEMQLKVKPKTSDHLRMEMEVKETTKPSDHLKIEMPVNPFKPKKTAAASGKFDGIKWNKCIKRKGALSSSVEAETDAHSNAKFSKDSTISEPPSISNDGDVNQNIVETALCSVHTSPKNETDFPSPNESFDTLENSASMAVSTFCTTESEPRVHGIVAKKEPHHIEYECHMKSFTFRNGDTMRQPLQTSMGWINQQQQLLSVAISVADQKESCNSSIINLQENDRNTLFVE